jgi:hypothetical protein
MYYRISNSFSAWNNLAGATMHFQLICIIMRCRDILAGSMLLEAGRVRIQDADRVGADRGRSSDNKRINP